MRDIDWSEAATYDWFADIWIPLALGVATVVVAFAAVKASNRAGELAEKVERVRLEEEERWRSEERRLRLRDLAIEQAQLAWIWFDLTSRGFAMWPGEVGPQPERDPSIARRNAEAALLHSLVPGARDLFEIISFDLEHQFEHLPDAPRDRYGKPVTSEPRDVLIRARRERSESRIRNWGLDPNRTAATIAEDLNRARTTPEVYLKTIFDGPH